MKWWALALCLVAVSKHALCRTYLGLRTSPVYFALLMCTWPPHSRGHRALQHAWLQPHYTSRHCGMEAATPALCRTAMDLAGTHTAPDLLPPAHPLIMPACHQCLCPLVTGSLWLESSALRLAIYSASGPGSRSAHWTSTLDFSIHVASLQSIPSLSSMRCEHRPPLLVSTIPPTRWASWSSVLVLEKTLNSWPLLTFFMPFKMLQMSATSYPWHEPERSQQLRKIRGLGCECRIRRTSVWLLRRTRSKTIYVVISRWQEGQKLQFAFSLLSFTFG